MTTGSAKERQLNPFAFPAETNIRFILLIIAALSLIFPFTYSIYGTYTTITRGEFINVISTSIEESDIFLDLDYNDTSLVIREFLRVSKTILFSFTYAVVSALIVFLLAFIIYRTYPKRIRRRNNYRPFNIFKPAQSSRRNLFGVIFQKSLRLYIRSYQTTRRNGVHADIFIRQNPRQITR